MLLPKGQQHCMGLQGFGRRGQIVGGNPCNFFQIHPLAHCTLIIPFLIGWQMRMYPSKTKMLGFTIIGSDKVQVEVEEAIPVAEVHQFIDG